LFHYRYVSIGDIARVGSHAPTVAAVYRNIDRLFALPVGYDLVRNIYSIILTLSSKHHKNLSGLIIARPDPYLLVLEESFLYEKGIEIVSLYLAMQRGRGAFSLYLIHQNS
jgi:hypothetical protein